MATIYDIAREAGVSIATVSKVMNQTGRISDKTRKHVLDIMKKSDYQPSVVASALTKKRTYTLGLLIPDLANPFFAEVARSIEDSAQLLGYNLVISSTDNELSKEERYVNVLRQKRVDGIILATGARSDSIVKQLLKQKLPIAVIAREMPSFVVDTVLVDDFLGGYLATSHLIELGHRRIAVIAEDLGVMSSRERVRGYKQALEESGIAYEDRLVVVSPFHVQGGKETATELLRGPLKPTAIFACNDLLAIGVVQAVREQGMSVPQDVSVVGFDNTLLATIIDPSLTTVAQPIQEMGRQIVQLITQEIDGSKPNKQRLVLLPELVIRNSTTKITLTK
ncbi:LacI family transcriptional regulator [Paenibacillus selenitireducens]|uniref:LacI family transcriptional regulator n=1 Tax=Paenibacillus selenitireducens TaxID=1324314 RepID=A0A1T2X5S2_9BACL|nr:LacI family DNA-binding transcriptional regulator [Paenibacillus selenitireducens]OPA75202.1 LacI family transcriptional regulator [Paenibacillus selenitireducens]